MHSENTILNFEREIYYKVRLRALTIIYIVIGFICFTYSIVFLIAPKKQSQLKNKELLITNYSLQVLNSILMISIGTCSIMCLCNLLNRCKAKTLNVAAKIEIFGSTLVTIAIFVVHQKLKEQTLSPDV